MSTLPTAARSRRATSGRASSRRWLAPHLFLLPPAGLLFLAFLAIPIVYALYLSVRGMRIEDVGPPFGSRRRPGWA